MDEYPSLTGSRLVLMTIALSLAIFMNVLDISIANVAIPNIAGDLGVSPDNGTWIITSFAVSQAIMLPLTGWLARQVGEVRLFMYSTALFTLMSVLCGFAQNLEMLIFFRVLQGAVSGPMIPLSQSILLSGYPPEGRSFATGIWAMTAVVGPIAGPVLGGWITDNYSWPWIFYINVPVGIFSVVFTKITLRGRETKITKSPVDYIGLALLASAVGCLQVVLDKGNDLDWFNSQVIVTLSIISFISFCFLIAWVLTQREPIVDLTLFLNRNFLIATICLSLGYLLYFSNVVIFPLWLQTQMGYTPTWAGLAVAPVGIMSVFISPLLGRYLGLMDMRIWSSIGFLIFFVTSYWQSFFYTDVGYWQLIEPRLVQGFGLSLFFTPLISLVISELPASRNASAFGLSNFCRILGGSFGTSISVTLWDHREAWHQSHLVESVNAYNPLSYQMISQLHDYGFAGLKSMGAIYGSIIQQAFMLSTNDIFRGTSWIFLALIAILWFANPTHKASQALGE